MTPARLLLAGAATYRLALPCLALSVVAGLVPAGPVGGLPKAPATAGAGHTVAVGLLDRAQEAAATQSFEGTLAVEWRDGRQEQHSEQVRVSSAGGVMRFGNEVVGAGARRMVNGAEGWSSLWAHEVATLGPSPTEKYRLAVGPGPEVAARPTDVIAVHLRGMDRLRERIYVDRQSGLVLRRELLDSGGTPYRAVGFLAITTGAGRVEAASLTRAPRAAHSQEPAPARHLKAPYKVKSRIGTGYRLVGAYKANGVVHQFFSDGLHGLSVFEQRGQLSAAETSLAGEVAAGRRVEIAGHTMWAYSASVGEAVVWESDGVVYTAVTDAPWGDLAEAVGDLPHGDPPGRLRRLAQAVVSLFRWT